jgi:hypothetical protein
MCAMTAALACCGEMLNVPDPRLVVAPEDTSTDRLGVQTNARQLAGRTVLQLDI